MRSPHGGRLRERWRGSEMFNDLNVIDGKRMWLKGRRQAMSYHFAASLTEPAACGTKPPSEGWHELTDEEFHEITDRRSGFCDRCIRTQNGG